jgi:lipopolysaccharide transport system permease protein
MAEKGNMKSAELSTIARLSWELFSRDMVSRYRGSKLGYVWLLVSPLALAGVWIYIMRMGNLNMGDSRTSYVAYVTTGMFLWQGFTRQVLCSMTQLAASRHLFSKYVFPWEAIVLAAWAESMVEFAVSMAVLVVVLGISGSISGWGMMISVPWMASLLLLGGGLGLLLAPFGLLYEDVGRGLSLLLQLMFFMIPIVYPRPTQGAARLVVEWNPIAILLIAARDELLLGEATMFYRAAAASLLGFGVVVLGFAILRVARPHLAVSAN